MAASITQDSTLSLVNGQTNGETFLLFGSNLHVTVAGLQGNMTFIIGVNNSLYLNGDGIIGSGQSALARSETIFDFAQGTHLRINTLGREMAEVDIQGFQFDRTGSLSVDFGGTPTLIPDGHGGTFARFNLVTVDFIGDTRVQLSQLHGGPPAV
jgi:hypothetical protein